MRLYRTHVLVYLSTCINCKVEWALRSELRSRNGYNYGNEKNMKLCTTPSDCDLPTFPQVSRQIFVVSSISSRDIITTIFYMSVAGATGNYTSALLSTRLQRTLLLIWADNCQSYLLFSHRKKRKNRDTKIWLSQLRLNEALFNPILLSQICAEKSSQLCTDTMRQVRDSTYRFLIVTLI